MNTGSAPGDAGKGGRGAKGQGKGWGKGQYWVPRGGEGQNRFHPYIPSWKGKGKGLGQGGKGRRSARAVTILY